MLAFFSMATTALVSVLVAGAQAQNLPAALDQLSEASDWVAYFQGLPSEPIHFQPGVIAGFCQAIDPDAGKFVTPVWMYVIEDSEKQIRFGYFLNRQDPTWLRASRLTAVWGNDFGILEQDARVMTGWEAVRDYHLPFYQKLAKQSTGQDGDYFKPLLDLLSRFAEPVKYSSPLLTDTPVQFFPNAGPNTPIWIQHKDIPETNNTGFMVFKSILDPNSSPFAPSFLLFVDRVKFKKMGDTQWISLQETFVAPIGGITPPLSQVLQSLPTEIEPARVITCVWQ